MAGVNECACLSAVIVNETLAQIQHGQIFTTQARDFITDKSVILQEVLDFFILPQLRVNSRSNLPRVDGCGAAGSILPLTYNQSDFNLNHMNQHQPGAETKYLNENI